jgi:uncharacterized protein involved in outer membrane biogenesis
VLKKLLVILVVLVVLVVFLLMRDWDSPELGQALLDKAGEATGVEMSAEGFRLNLLRGLVLENVKAKSSSSGRDVNVSLDRLVFEHRLGPLLSGTVAIESVVLEHPLVELTETGGAPTETRETSPAEVGTPEAEEGAPSTEESGGLALAIRSIAVEDGTMIIQSADGRSTRLVGLDVLFQDIAYVPRTEPPIHGFAAQGELGVREVSFDELEIRDVSAELSVAEGRFEMKPLRFVMDEGRFTAEMQVDFNPAPFAYSLNAQGDPLDFNAMAGADGGFGPGLLGLSATGKGTDSKDVQGKGSITLADGQFPATELFGQIDETLGKPVMVGTTYKATELRFSLADNIVTVEPFPFETEQAKIELQGWVDLEGPLSLDFAMGVVREGIQIEGVGEDVLNVLTDDEGWVMIPLSVTGTKDQPRVWPDSKALIARAGQGMKRLAKEKATDAITGFFRKKKKP